MKRAFQVTALFLSAVLVACEATPGCPEGQVADGDVCVPEGCGVGTWGDLSVDGDTVYVNLTAEAGGDGSADAPLTSIQAGLDRAGIRGGERVAVAAGTYAEALALDHGHAGVQLAGRCRELVTLDASGVDAHAAIRVAAEPGDEITIRGLTVTGGATTTDEIDGGTADAGGLVVLGGSVTAEEADLVENRRSGVSVSGVGSRLSLSQVMVADSVPVELGVEFVPGLPSLGGFGIFVEQGAFLEARDVVIQDNVEQGLLALGPETEVVLAEGIVRDTRPSPLWVGGAGVLSLGAVSLAISDARIEGNPIQLAADGLEGAEVVVERAEMRGGESPDAFPWLEGVQVHGEVTFSMRSSVIEDVHNYGIYSDHPGVSLDLEDVELRNIVPRRDGVSWAALTVLEGGALRAVDVRVEDSSGPGMIISGSCEFESPPVELREVEVRGTRKATFQTAAPGIVVQRHREVEAVGVRVEGTEGPGVFVVHRSGLVCRDCVLDGCAFVGALVLNESNLTLLDSTVEGTVPDVHNGGGVGVYAGDEFGGRNAVTLDRCTLGPHRVAAAWLEGSGSFLIRDSTLYGNDPIPILPGVESHGDALYVEYRLDDDPNGLYTTVTLEDSHFADAGGAGVFLHGVTATLSGNEFTGNEVDLWQQHCLDVDPPAGVEEAPVQELCPEPERLNLRLDLDMNGEIAGVE